MHVLVISLKVCLIVASSRQAPRFLPFLVYDPRWPRSSVSGASEINVPLSAHIIHSLSFKTTR